MTAHARVLAAGAREEDAAGGTALLAAPAWRRTVAAAGVVPLQVGAGRGALGGSGGGHGLGI